MKPKIVIGLNTAWNLLNFRSGLIRAFVSHGYEVVAVAPADEYVERVCELGCRFIALPMSTRGKNPLMDLVLLWRFWRVLRQEQPAAYLGFTVKPNIYGSIAAHVLRIPVVNNIAGLGTVFASRTWLTRVVSALYRLALGRAAKVFFQNRDDLVAFADRRLVRPEQAALLPGSGVDLQRFQVVARADTKTSPMRFLLVARLLWEKGIREYVEAARIVKARDPSVEFALLGFVDGTTSDAVSPRDVKAWVKEGIVSYLGVSDDVPSVLATADCVVLPSYYREGVPRTLLEAAAMGRPIITTDWVGCREVVKHGVNGYLCAPRDAADLAAKIELMRALSPAAREHMGQEGRRRVEQLFDEQIVIREYLHAVAQVCREHVRSALPTMRRQR